ncbi:substrate-binding domain-containing protein [Oricola sp.]|uniref:substrate-binding domain-containing protein n=1 Tax=Oricola sp. TaxID=1979950 RepID=UPI003BA8E01C
MSRHSIFAAVLALGAVVAGSATASEQSILVQSTTSTANSGLYDYLLPIFQEKTGIRVDVVAVGTGQAIKNAKNCDADVLLVHAKPAEEKFVADGHGIKRFDLMYNDFVIVGPAEDPAGVAGSGNVLEALQTIADAKAMFASRGDDSGTHKAELRLWKAADIDPSTGSGEWYREMGSGMGATLNAGVGMGAYVMTDRATWISFNNKGDFKVAVEGDSKLFNQYGVIRVNEERCPDAKVEAGQRFVDWLISDAGQSAIANFKVGGQALFFPNAKTGEM